MDMTQLPSLPDLPAELERLVAQIPSGKVTTYGDLAKALGNVVAARWVGTFLLHDPRSADWPTHRVIRADGSLGLYAHGDEAAKARRLQEEGVRLRRGKVDLNTYGVDSFQTSRPLESLRRLQDRLPSACVLQADETEPRTIAGLDVSYAGGNVGVGGYALVDAASGELLWSTTVRCEVNFPYISSYLAFRELPVLVQLLQAARSADSLADVFMVDGAGIMHPRRAGIAAHFGVLADVPTIGITKKLLAGRFDEHNAAVREPRRVTHGDDVLGAAMRPRETSNKFIWASPGHRMDVETATAITLQTLRGRRLPEPIHWADRLSRQACSRQEER